MSWIHGETKFNCHIKLSISFGEEIFKKVIIIIAKNSKKLISLLNDAKLIIHKIDKIETYFVMVKTPQST